MEILLLRQHSGLFKDISLDCIPDALYGHTNWQYGTGQHASMPRHMLRYISRDAISDNGKKIYIKHLVLDGSSQWFIDKNVTNNANILHANRSAIQFYNDGHADRISIYDHKFLSYMDISVFMPNESAITPTSCSWKTMEWSNSHNRRRAWTCMRSCKPDWPTTTSRKEEHMRPGSCWLCSKPSSERRILWFGCSTAP